MITRLFGKYIGKRTARLRNHVLFIAVVGLVIFLLYHGRSDKCFKTVTEQHIKQQEPCKSKSANTRNEKLKPAPTPVVILSHARSGSSFVADVLQANTMTFFLFEPFHSIKLSISKHQRIVFLNGTSRYYGKDEYSSLAVEIMHAILTCDFDSVPMNIWQGPYALKSKSTMSVRTCKSRDMKSCVMSFKRTCQNSPHVLVKTTRIPLFLMESLMPRIPSLRLINLMRDPRAIIHSWVKLNWIKKSQLEDSSIKICNEIYDDIVIYQQFERIHRKRIIMIFYEDMAYDPIPNFKTLLEFIRMGFTEIVRQHIVKITASDKKCGSFCTLRANSTEEAEQWRKNVDLRFVQTIDRNCAQLYRKVGYLKISDEKMLKNLKYDLRYEPDDKAFSYG